MHDTLGQGGVHGQTQFADINGLGQHAEKRTRQLRVFVKAQRIAGNQDQRQGRPARVQSVGEDGGIAVGEAQVENGEVRMTLVGQGQGARGVGGFEDDVALALQDTAEDLPNRGIIVYDQDCRGVHLGMHHVAIPPEGE